MERNAMKRVIVPLADGFEEIEAVTVIDILRRAGLDVVAAGIDAVHVTGSHGITVHADTLFAEEAVAVPGTQVRVDVSATNSVNIKQFIVPINFGGPYNLIFDSASVVGLRTEYFDNVGQAGFEISYESVH